MNAAAATVTPARSTVRRPVVAPTPPAQTNPFAALEALEQQIRGLQSENAFLRSREPAIAKLDKLAADLADVRSTLAPTAAEAPRLAPRREPQAVVPKPSPSTPPLRPAEARRERREALAAYLLAGHHQTQTNAQIADIFGLAEPTVRRTLWEMTQTGQVKHRVNKLPRRKPRRNRR